MKTIKILSGFLVGFGAFFVMYSLVEWFMSQPESVIFPIIFFGGATLSGGILGLLIFLSTSK